MTAVRCFRILAVLTVAGPAAVELHPTILHQLGRPAVCTGAPHDVLTQRAGVDFTPVGRNNSR